MIRNTETAVAIIVVGIAMSIAVGVTSYYYSLTHIKDPISMCFATANGEREMNICLKLKELSGDR
jgi:hypothetical protein